MTENNTRQQRHLLDRLLDVYQVQSNELLGFLRNLSDNGGMIISNKPLLNEQPIHLEVVDRYAHDTGRKIPIEATCRWSRKIEKRDLFESGFSFQGLNSQAEEGISNLIDAYSLTTY